MKWNVVSMSAPVSSINATVAVVTVFDVVPPTWIRPIGMNIGIATDVKIPGAMAIEY